MRPASADAAMTLGRAAARPFAPGGQMSSLSPVAPCPPPERQIASTTVTIASQRVILLRGTWVSVTQAIAVYQASAHGAASTQAKHSANGATISRGCSEEIRW